jgi:hypothetical protein
MNYVFKRASLQTGLPDWEGDYLNDEMHDFDNDLLSGKVVDL